MKSTKSISRRKTRILVADDHPLFREGLVQLINREHDLCCCGETDSVAATYKAVGTLKPDLLVMDLRMGDGDGLELIKALKTHFPDLPVLVLSQHDETLYAERALRAGARGYVMKEEATEEVLNAMRTILKGELYVSRKMSVVVLKKLVGSPSATSGRQIERLSDRELQVFQMLGSGMSTRQVAAQLHLSFKTVETHRENIKHKLGLRDSAELVRHAAHWVQRRPSGPSPRL